MSPSELGFHIISKELQSLTKLLEKVFPIMSTFLCNETISKTTPLRKENPFPQFNVASHKRPGIRLSFKYTTTLLSGEGREGRTGTATMLTKMLSKYTIFSTVLSKIVDLGVSYPPQLITPRPLNFNPMVVYLSRPLSLPAQRKTIDFNVILL